MTLPELRVNGRPNLQVLDTTSSTNDHARAWARAGAPDGATVVADQQTAGRGRSDRSWYSPPGVNLYVSQVLRAPVDRLRLAPILGAVAVREALQAHLPASIKPVIKWPNDLLVNGQKLAGILAELESHPQPVCILGIGINVNLDEPDLPKDARVPASSLRLITGKAIDRRVVLTSVLNAMDAWRDCLDSNQEKLLQAFTSHCITLGKRVKISLPDQQPFYAKARSIDHQGRLIVEDHQDRLTPIQAGDVDLSE